jgi:hypothetical protein
MTGRPRLRIDLEHGLEDGPVPQVVRLLLQIADDGALDQPDVTSIRLLATGDHLQQRRLAGPIRPHDRQTVARPYRELCVPKEVAPAEALPQSRDDEHVPRLPATSGPVRQESDG